jgi:hypothetical protein
MKTNTVPDKETIHDIVRENYAKAATGQSRCCGCYCSTETPAQTLGYSAEEIAVLPEGADLGLGCGIPKRLHRLSRERPFSTSAAEQALIASSLPVQSVPLAVSSVWI